MPNARSREAPAVIIIVISNPPVRAAAVLSDESEDRGAKTRGKGPREGGNAGPANG